MPDAADPRPPVRALRPRHRVEAVLMRLGLAVVRLVPVDLASALGGWFGRLIGRLAPVSRVGRANLAAAFPEKSPAEIAAILAGVWDNLGRTVAEYPHLLQIWDYEPFAEAQPARPRIEIVGAEQFVAMALDGRPGLIFTGHLGNWELLAVGAQAHGLDVAVIYRPPNNPVAVELVQQLRGAAMGRMLPNTMEGAVAAVELLRAGGHLGLLIDQHFSRGVSVPFFGRPVQVPVTLARLARRFDCPVRGARVERLGGARFRITITPPLALPRSADEVADIREASALVTRILEGWVRERPEQWLWLHRRWR
jgi:KDO2-lipid IV(A) lauroyltransferase